jgi:hypothetical protein
VRRYASSASGLSSTYFLHLTRPLDLLDLTLEHLDLAPQRQHLSLELGLVAPAGGKRVEQDSKDGVQRRHDHGHR